MRFKKSPTHTLVTLTCLPNRAISLAFVVVMMSGLSYLPLFCQLRQISWNAREQAGGKPADTMQRQRALQAFGGLQPWQGFLKKL